MSISSKIKNAIKWYQDTKPRPIVIENVEFKESQLLSGRSALITGGTSGIGYQIAKAFSKSGCRVTITGRSIDRLEKAKADLEKEGCQGVSISVMDISNVHQSEQVFDKITEECSMDILVNNAGVLGARMPYATEKEFDNVFGTNVKGMFFLSQHIAKYFIKNKIKGNILNISSSSSMRPAISAYTASKWSVRGLTLGLAKSLAQHGITVNAIAPGPTATPMLLNEGESLEKKDSPIGRFILPEEIANMAVILVSPLGKSIIGDTIFMTGGAGLITYDDMNYNFGEFN